MKAYDDTPASVHHFLPIVSLGNDEDKNIPWGATVPDKFGNYYYTSFLPAGFVAPYIFVKIFNLPMNATSLYLFNSILYILCFIMVTILFVKLFKDRLNVQFIVLLVAAIYLFQSEILHSQGIVYWHHSLFQLLFLIQLNLFVRLESKAKWVFFFILSLALPCVEWTGYISNIGLAIAFFFNDGMRLIKRICTFLAVIVLTLISCILFISHFLSVLYFEAFKTALISRFMARNVTTKISFSHLIRGYSVSFGLTWVLIIALTLVVIFKKESRQTLSTILKQNKSIIFVVSFAMLENILMLEHAIFYSFDRMKMVLPILLILFSLICSLDKTYNLFALYKFVFLSLIFSVSIINLLQYSLHDNKYKWDVDYLENNIIFSRLINAKYNKENSVIGQSLCVRGYTNLLFNRGIYELQNLESLKSISLNKGKTFAILLLCENEPWNMYKYTGAIIYNIKTDEIYEIKI